MMRLSILERLGLYRPLDYDQKRFQRLANECNEIEKIFWSVSYFELSKWGIFTPQLRVAGYRLDFALVGNGFKVAIEIDGREYHTSEAQRCSDYRRQRDLERRGWRFVRFTASEIHGDAQGALSEAIIGLRGLQ